MSARISPEQLLIREPQETIERIKRFLQTHKEKAGARLFVVGMSGGLDSSVTASLCALAAGGRNVLGVSMPEKETWNEKNVQDARAVAKKFGVRFKLLDITKLVEATTQSLAASFRRTEIVAYGNVKARLRAMVLYYFANTKEGLVAGTGDKSEIMLGYFTKYGDGACDTQPLADLYKTTVRDLAKHLRLPSRIYSKRSSPELWPGQTAEKELGLGYEKLDLILWGLERWMVPEEIAVETGLPLKMVRLVRERWLASEHKRRPPLALKMGYRTAGMDLRLPHTPGRP